MRRILIVKKDNRIWRMSTTATEGSLLDDWVKNGGKPDEVSEEYVDDLKYQEVKLKDPVYVSNQESIAAAKKAKADAIVKISEIEADLQKAGTIAALKVIVTDLINCVKVLV